MSVFSVSYFIRTLIIFFMLPFVSHFSVHTQSSDHDSLKNDRVMVQSGSLVIFSDSTIYIEKDTLLQIPSGVRYRIEKLSLKKPAFYDSLEVRTDGNFFTRWLYDAIFVSSVASNQTEDFLLSGSAFEKWQGQKIASIQLKKVDVQAGSILDTTQYAEAGLAKILNQLHIPTRDFVIRENLLFEEGDTVNSDLLADNERILRSLTYIEDARIYIKSHGKDEKKVDVLIVIKDVFPIGFDPVVTDLNNYRFELFDKNFAGLGTELRYKFYYNDAKFPPCGHEALYWMNNLHGTFIDGFLQYRYVYGETLVRVNFAKEFLTPRTRFAGGLDLGRISETRIEIENGLKVRVPNAFNFGDIWGGRAFQVGDESSRRTNVLALRYRKDDVTSRPFVSPDSNRYYHDSDLLLGSVVFRKSEYYKSSLIRSFGTTEDIPVGWLYKFTVGLEAGEFYDRPYFGFEFVRTYVKISAGYLGYGMGIGAFYHQQRWQQGAVKFNSTYVAPLLKKHGFRFRNILNLDITLGIRQSEREYIDVDAEIRGISDFELSGKNKMVLSLESIAFSPWELAGFRFAFYAFSDFGFLSDDRHFNRSDFYGIAGLGCRIRNESLVFNTLVLRIGYYPRVPDGYSQWKFDLSSKDPRFFTDIHTLKPHLITYE